MLPELTEHVLHELNTLLLAFLLGLYLLLIAQVNYDMYMIFISSYISVYIMVVVFTRWQIDCTPDGTFIHVQTQARIPNIQPLCPNDDLFPQTTRLRGGPTGVLHCP